MGYIHLPISQNECNHYVLPTPKNKNKKWKGCWRGEDWGGGSVCYRHIHCLQSLNYLLSDPLQKTVMSLASEEIKFPLTPAFCHFWIYPGIYPTVLTPALVQLCRQLALLSPSGTLRASNTAIHDFMFYYILNTKRHSLATIYWKIDEFFLLTTILRIAFSSNQNTLTYTFPQWIFIILAREQTQK